MMAPKALSSGSRVGMLLLALLSLTGATHGHNAADDSIPRSNRSLQEQQQAGDAGRVFFVRDAGR